MSSIRSTILPFIVLLVSCSTNYEMMVQSYHNPETDFGKFRTFAVLPITKGNPTLQRELLFQVKITMINRGYKYNPVKPDFLIAMDLLSADYTPPGAIRVKTLPSVDESGKKIGPEPIIIRSSGPGTDTTAARDDIPFGKLVITIADNRRSHGGAAPVVWEGVARTPHTPDNVTVVTRTAVAELLSDFPGTGRGAVERKIPIGTGR